MNGNNGFSLRAGALRRGLPRIYGAPAVADGPAGAAAGGGERLGLVPRLDRGFGFIRRWATVAKIP
jgi:hypothetical protein